MSKRIGGTINRWRSIDWSGNKDFVITGFITGDSNWPDDMPIRTSLIVKISDDKTQVETLNTIYKLGVPFEEWIQNKT